MRPPATADATIAGRNELHAPDFHSRLYLMASTKISMTNQKFFAIADFSAGFQNSVSKRRSRPWPMKPGQREFDKQVCLLRTLFFLGVQTLSRRRTLID
jgi:hypothetical protein